MPNKCQPSLRHLLVLQACNEAEDGQGGFTDTWSTIASLWASIEPIKAYERYQAMQLQTPVTHKITLRYNASVTNKHRFKYGDRIFAIQEVINVEERNRYILVKAVERQ